MFKYLTPVLVYNCIGYYPEPVMGDGVKKENFERQMKYLSGNGYNVISADTLIDHINNHKKLPKKPVVLTFDFGFKDSYHTAFPILHKYGYTATIFVPTDYVSRQVPFNGSKLDCLNWDEIREMEDAGMLIGAHGRRGKVLGLLEMDELKDEVVESQKVLKSQTKRGGKYFSLTERIISDEAKKILSDSGYVAAFSLAPTYCRQDIFTISRVKIDCNDDIPTFKTKLSLSYALFKDSNKWKLLRKYGVDKFTHWIFRVAEKNGMSKG